MKRGSKNAKQLERHFKGVASHWRIRILTSVAKEPGLSLDALWQTLEGNEKTISEHTRKLVHAGLIDKTYLGRTVQHNLSPYGKIFYNFIQSL